jgi:hypothetical protein
MRLVRLLQLGADDSMRSETTNGPLSSITIFAGPLQRDSIMRFDELQSVAINQLEHTGFSLATEVLDVVRAQAAFFLTGTGGDNFLGYRSLLAEA